MRKIETDFIDVPLEFKIACEAFGMMVSDFLQLILQDFSYYYLFGHDDSANDLATKAFAYAEHEILK